MSRFGLGLISGASGTPGNDSFTKILLHMDGANGGTTFIDSNAGGSPRSWAPSTALTTTSSAVFDQAMVTSSGYITTPDSADFTLGSSNWTVDFWVNRGGTSGQMALFGQTDSTNSTPSTSIVGQFLLGGQFGIEAYSGTTRFAINTSTTFSDSNWRHVAAVRSGSTLLLFVNGNLESSGGIGVAINDSANAWSVGRTGESGGHGQFSGLIDEFRLSVGIARWTSNFTPPNAPYI